jgi:tight adherence protein G
MGQSHGVTNVTARVTMRLSMDSGRPGSVVTSRVRLSGVRDTSLRASIASLLRSLPPSQAKVMSPTRHKSRRRTDGERGATLILVAISLTMFLAASGLSIDIGRTVVVNRTLQSLADSTALDAARYIGIADEMTKPANQSSYLSTEVANALTNSGGVGGETTTWSFGLWNASTSTVTSPMTGCALGNPPAVHPCNAIQVTVYSNLADLFQPGTTTLSRSSTAEMIPEAGFSIGTYLANVTTGTNPSYYNTQQIGVLNDLFTALGGSANVTALGYAGLANTDLTVQQLINASGGVLTPTNVMTTSLSPESWLSTITSAVQLQVTSLTCSGSQIPFPCDASGSSGLGALGPFSSARPLEPLCDLIIINNSTCGSTLSQIALSNNINVLQLLTTEAEVANGTNALNVTTAMSLPGVTSVTLSFPLIQLPAVAYGPIGTTAASSGQVDATFTLTILGQTVSIPVTGATGSATLLALACSSTNTVSSTQIQASTQAAASSITLNGAALSSLAVNAVNTTTLIFTVVPPTYATITGKTNPVYIGSTAPTLSFSGSGTVVALLNADLDLVLSPVLQSLGMSIGGAQVALLSAKCGNVDLVQ